MLPKAIARPNEKLREPITSAVILYSILKKSEPYRFETCLILCRIVYFHGVLSTCAIIILYKRPELLVCAALPRKQKKLRLCLCYLT